MSNGTSGVQQQKYTYSPLVDAVVCVNQKVNFYGIVTEFEQPKYTRGGGSLSTSNFLARCIVLGVNISIRMMYSKLIVNQFYFTVFVEIQSLKV